MIPVAIDEPDPAPPVPEQSSAAARAVIVLADGTRLEIDATHPAEA